MHTAAITRIDRSSLAHFAHDFVVLFGGTLSHRHRPPCSGRNVRCCHSINSSDRRCTLHAVWVSADSQPTIDQQLIPGKTNEQGCFAEFFEKLRRTYGRSNRLECISVDPGMTASANAKLIDDAGVGYIMAVKDDQPTLLAEIQRQCGCKSQKQLGHKCEWASPWQSYRGSMVRRELFRSMDIEGWPNWKSARQAWRIKQTTVCGDGELSIMNRYFVTNLAKGKLKPREIVQAVRLHWGSENACHWTLDVVLKEDQHPWCTRGQALRMLSWVRLLALNTLGFIRNRYLRRSKLLPWQSLPDGVLQFLLIQWAGKPHSQQGNPTACC